MNKQLVKSAQALVEPADGLVIQKGQLVLTPQLLEGLELAESLQKEIDAFYGSIKTFLQMHKCKGGETELGYVKLSESPRLYADETVKARFLKTTIDTEEVRRWQKKNAGKLPAGVTEKVSVRLIKKVKKV